MGKVAKKKVAPGRTAHAGILRAHLMLRDERSVDALERIDDE